MQYSQEAQSVVSSLHFTRIAAKISTISLPMISTLAAILVSVQATELYILGNQETEIILRSYYDLWTPYKFRHLDSVFDAFDAGMKLSRMKKKHFHRRGITYVVSFFFVSW